MKILNICGYTWAIGGPARIIYDHAVVQCKLGHDVTILTPVWPADEVYPVPAGAKVITVKRHWFARFFPEFSIELWYWLKKNGDQFDVIHVHGPFHFAGMAPFLLNLKPAKAITIHGLLDRWAIRHGYWKKKIVSFLIQKKILRQANLIQINNLDEQADLLRYLGFQHPNVAIIPNGMRMGDFTDLPVRGTFREQFQISENQELILFMGRINIKKGLDLLLPAFEQLTRQRHDCVLVLAGPDDGYLTDTQDFIEKYQLQEKIRLVGMLTGEIKLGALTDADIFVLPSYSEGFSIAVLEAMAAQVPVLVSDRVGFGPEIKQAKAGHLIELTAASVSIGLNQMLSDPDYRNTLKINAYQLVKTHYDIEVVAGQLVSEFQKIATKQ